MAAKDDGKTFKQDMVVSSRFRNELPPPPMPPKLLDIDTGDVSQYTEPSYASRLARKEIPNIEFDAEGGMPIDMIGMPGYFLGDESAITAPEVAPVLDPADAALIVTLEQLRSGGARSDGHSFLRKTQYMSSSNTRTNTEPLINKGRTRKPLDNKNSAPVARDDKENIKRHLQKGFDLAYPDSIPYNPPEAKAAPITPAERDAWRVPVHPDNPKLKPVAFYPIMPDLGTGTDAGQFSCIKFDKAPLPERRDRRDDRIDAGIFTAFTNESLRKAWEPRKEAFDRDPEHYEDPGPEPSLYALYVPKNAGSTPRVRRMLNDSDPQKDNPNWFAEISEPDAQGVMRLPFSRVKTYHGMKRLAVDSHKYMAMVLHDPKAKPQSSRFSKQGPAAYYYPIVERDSVKTGRGKADKSSARRGNVDEDDDVDNSITDEVMLLFTEESMVQKAFRSRFLGEHDSSFKEKYEQIERDALAEQEKEHANAIEQEQGLLHEGAQDVSMAEVEAADEMEVVGNGSSQRADRDDDMTD